MEGQNSGFKIFLKKSLEIISGVFFILLLTVVLLGVLDRYLFMLGWGWPEHLARLFFIACSFLSAALVVKDDEHFKSDFVLKKLFNPINFRRVEVINIFIIMIFILIIIITGINLGIANWDQRMSSIPQIRVSLFQFFIPLSGILMIIFYIRKIFNLYKLKPDNLKSDSTNKIGL